LAVWHLGVHVPSLEDKAKFRKKRLTLYALVTRIYIPGF
jgi:hypothetical protein